MKKYKLHVLNLFLCLGCITLMSFTEPSPKSKFIEWSKMACTPSGEAVNELTCKQCYYVLWIAFDCRDCVGYVGQENPPCKDY